MPPPGSSAWSPVTACPPATGSPAYRAGSAGGFGRWRPPQQTAGLHAAFYYIVTLLLQLIPYSLTGGAGVNLGIAAFASESRTGYRGPRMPWLRIPYEAILDAGWIYLISLRCSRLRRFLNSRCESVRTELSVSFCV